MPSTTEQIQLLKDSCSQNKCDSSVLNELTTQANNMQNEVNASDAIMSLTSLRKATIRQTIENDECDANTFKRHLCIAQTAGRPKNSLMKMH